MEFSSYIILGFAMAALFFASAVWALNWAIKNGQMKNLDEGAKSIFDDEEPMGFQTDFFPGQSHRVISKKNKGKATS